MSWIKWVESQIRDYMCRELRKIDIMEELVSMDEDIAVSVSRLDGMPRSHGIPSSPVERIAEHREEAEERFKEKLQTITDQAKRMENGLNKLDQIQREVIELAYMSLSYITDGDIAKRMKLSKPDFWKIKFQALAVIFESLKGFPAQYELQKLVQQEEHHYTRASKMDGEKPVRTPDLEPIKLVMVKTVELNPLPEPSYEQFMAYLSGQITFTELENKSAATV